MSEKLDAALADAKTLQAEIDNLKANQSVLFSFANDPDVEGEEDESPDRQPVSVAQAVDFATEDYPNLLILENCHRSAADSPFRRPGEIFQALFSMNKVAAVWSRERSGGDLRSMLKETGLGKRVSNFISQTSRRKWAEEYTFVYEGGARLFEWHVTLGAGAVDTCASIHLLPDASKGKLVVGHIGRHLTNTRS